MENKSKAIYSVLGLVTLGMVFSLVVGLQGFNSQSNSVRNVESTGIQYDAYVCNYVTRADGTVEDLGCSHNLLYNDGKDLIKTYLGDTGGSTDEVDQISLCNATAGCGVPVAGASEDYNEFTACGLAVGTGTYSSLGVGNWSIFNTFTSTCDSVEINATRLRNTASTNFAGNTFTLATLQTNDQITINWTIAVT